jgi:hypothetical protein
VRKYDLEISRSLQPAVGAPEKGILDPACFAGCFTFKGENICLKGIYYTMLTREIRTGKGAGI